MSLEKSQKAYSGLLKVSNRLPAPIDPDLSRTIIISTLFFCATPELAVATWSIPKRRAKMAIALTLPPPYLVIRQGRNGKRNRPRSAAGSAQLPGRKILIPYLLRNGIDCNVRIGYVLGAGQGSGIHCLGEF